MSSQTNNSELLLILIQQYKDAETKNNTGAMRNLLKAIRLIGDNKSPTEASGTKTSLVTSSGTAKKPIVLDSFHAEHNESDEDEDSDGSDNIMSGSDSLLSSSSSSDGELCRKRCRRSKKHHSKERTKREKKLKPLLTKKKRLPSFPVKVDLEDEEEPVLIEAPGFSGSKTIARRISIKKEQDVIKDFGHPFADKEIKIKLEPGLTPSKNMSRMAKSSNSKVTSRKIKKEFIPEEEDEVQCVSEEFLGFGPSGLIEYIKTEASDDRSQGNTSVGEAQCSADNDNSLNKGRNIGENIEDGEATLGNDTALVTGEGADEGGGDGTETPSLQGDAKVLQNLEKRLLRTRKL